MPYIAPSYPVHDVGGSAQPPARIRPQTVALAKEARRRTQAALPAEPSYGASFGNWRMAGSLVVLLDEANAANPRRDKASDGGIADDRHAKLPAGSTDHVPWVKDATGQPVVRARDLDTDGLDLPAACELARQRAAAGELPQLLRGGYIILNGKITAPDFSEWRAYTGADPHVTHAHFSVSLDQARYDDRRPWGLFGAPPAPTVPPQAPTVTPPRPTPQGWTGPDLRGSGAGLRGELGANGPRVASLQDFFRSRFSLYAKGLAVDGWWGQQTSGVLAEFAVRTGVRGADGANIGPQLARQLLRHGFRG